MITKATINLNDRYCSAVGLRAHLTGTILIDWLEVSLAGESKLLAEENKALASRSDISL